MQRLQLKFRVGAGGQRDASILIALPAAPGAGRIRSQLTRLPHSRPGPATR
jgi:hypothetical protein